MDSVEIVYYTCLNNECPKHRNIFTEGDPQHEGCARERLWLEGQRPAAPLWLRLAIPAAIIAAIAGAALAMRKAREARSDRPPLRETQMNRWSGADSHVDEREGSAVPPPIGSA
jgi:hypothetical protein